MIQTVSRLDNGDMLVMLGLLPENIEKLRQGDPVVISLGTLLPELKNYVISIADGAHLRPNVETILQRRFGLKKPPTVVDINIGPIIDKLVNNTHWCKLKVRGSAPKIELVLFYAESVEDFAARLEEAEIGIKEFHDYRGTAS